MIRPDALLKKDAGTGVFLNILRNFKNTFFTVHLRATASTTGCCLFFICCLVLKEDSESIILLFSHEDILIKFL